MIDTNEVERLRLRCICDDCWIWTGSTSERLPTVKRTINGKPTTVSARRVMFAASRGVTLYAGDRISTKCGNAACLNPEHLKRTTYSQVQKKISATAAGRALRIKAGLKSRTEGRSKIDMDKARYIRTSDKGSKELAAQFGVSRTLVNNIRRGEYWRDYSSPFAGLLAG